MERESCIFCQSLNYFPLWGWKGSTILFISQLDWLDNG